VLDSSACVLLKYVGTAHGGETVGGCLMRDGTLAPIAEGETESELAPELGCHRRFTARVRDALGRTVELDGEAFAVT
jgi:hypothetical protein